VIDAAGSIQIRSDDMIIQVDFNQNRREEGTIDVAELQKSKRKLESGLIAPADQDVALEVAEDHAAEPIKSMDDIIRISQYLISKGRYRDNMLFIVGINFGLRVSDLLSLTFYHIINEDFTFRERFPILEKKTKNTRKHRKNRYITINTAVMEAVTLYLEHTPGVKLSDYMFKRERQPGLGDKPLTRHYVHVMLKGIAEDLGLGIRMSTHTLRKTWAYHQMVMSNNDPRKLLLLTKMLNHSSITITLDYIGITAEEIDEAYRNLNLGSTTCNYLIDSRVGESPVAAG
jgi:integrase